MKNLREFSYFLHGLKMLALNPEPNMFCDESEPDSSQNGLFFPTLNPKLKMMKKSREFSYFLSP